MAKTQFTGNQILNNSIVRADHNIATTGLALITKLIAGTNMTISSTGIDPGTGDVTIHASGSTPVSSVFNRSGAVVKVVGDYNLSDLGGLFALTQLPALTGDFSTVAGAVATTLATVNANVGTFNSLTVNAKGLVTAASLVTNLIATPLNATALTGYSDNSTYYGNATTANGWPLNGTLTGQRFGVYGVQRVQNLAGSAQFNRSWDGTALAWRDRKSVV